MAHLVRQGQVRPGETSACTDNRGVAGWAEKGSVTVWLYERLHVDLCRLSSQLCH
ncbi:putative leader peptide [Sinosporangium siamense]